MPIEIPIRRVLTRQNDIMPIEIPQRRRGRRTTIVG